MKFLNRHIISAMAFLALFFCARTAPALAPAINSQARIEAQYRRLESQMEAESRILAKEIGKKLKTGQAMQELIIQLEEEKFMIVRSTNQPDEIRKDIKEYLSRHFDTVNRAVMYLLDSLEIIKSGKIKYARRKFNVQIKQRMAPETYDTAQELALAIADELFNNGTLRDFALDLWYSGAGVIYSNVISEEKQKRLYWYFKHSSDKKRISEATAELQIIMDEIISALYPEFFMDFFLNQAA